MSQQKSQCRRHPRDPRGSWSRGIPRSSSHGTAGYYSHGIPPSHLHLIIVYINQCADTVSELELLIIWILLQDNDSCLELWLFSFRR